MTQKCNKNDKFWGEASMVVDIYDWISFTVAIIQITVYLLYVCSILRCPAILHADSGYTRQCSDSSDRSDKYPIIHDSL